MEINVQQLKKRLDEGDKSFVFLDVREPHEYAEFNLGAKLIPLGTIPTAVATELDGLQDEEIIIHCRSGVRSGQAQQFLLQMGFTKVYNVTGGVVAWINNFGA
ncbi:MAG: hypothetical protein RL757_32 [Bacteroidota bacterium]|jgi:rhodanese-related sulfurtransferase